MHSSLKKAFVLYTALALIAPTGLLHAASEEVFNPNYIISDEELQDWRSMNRADIQAFLEEQRGYISTLQTDDKEGMRRPVSDIISRVSEEHHINPKYLLVKLQKEQSLVTDQDPTQKQLDWATGYGVCDSCKTTDPAIQKHKGFGVQVDSAAAIMRWYYDHVQKEPWIKKPFQSYLIDGQSVVPANLATAFLYTYTPHIHGNQNFWNLWQKWFEQVYPDGSILKSAEDPTVYLIQDGKKRPFNSFNALITRFDPKYIITVPASELTRYELGNAIALPNYSVVRDGNRLYLIDHDIVRPFESEEVVRSLGYHPDEIIDVTASEITGLEQGKVITAAVGSAPLGELLRIKENNTLYLFQEGVLHPISDPHIAAVNFPHLTEKGTSMSSLPPATIGPAILFKDGTLIQVKGENKVYVVEKGKKRHIASEDVFNGLGYRWDNILLTDEFTGLNHPTGQPLYLRQEVATQNSQTSLTSSQPDTSAPPSQNSPAKMIAVSEEESQYVGEKFTTQVNTYLVADYMTGEVLAGKNIDVVRPAASFTKVLTAYRLMREGLSPSKVTTYNPSEHDAIYGKFRVVEGEKIFNKDLLDAMLVSSLNTPARMLVDAVEPDESAFVKRMNDQLPAWGLTKTRMADVAGENLGTVTTAREYATLFSQAVKNVDVHDILSKKEYRYVESKDLDNKPNHFDTHSNELVGKQNLPFEITVSKTGYLEEAGAGLAMVIKRPHDGKQFLLITMGNPDYSHRFDEPERLARWVIQTF